MGSSVRKYLGGAVDEAVDVRRDEFHTTFISPDVLSDRMTSQSYRPEVVEALLDLRTRHRCMPLRKLAARRIRQGTSPEYGEGGPQCVKLKDVRQIVLRLTRGATVSARFAMENQDSIVSSEAVFINRSGGFTVGRSAAYLKESPIFASDDVFSFLPAESCDAAFIACYLNSWWGKRALEAGIYGSTGQLKLAQSHVESLSVPVVTYELQRAIGNKVRKAERLRELAGQNWATANRLLSDALKLPIEHSFFRVFGQADAATADYRCTTIDPPSAWALADEAIAAQYYHPRRVRTRKLAKACGRSERLDELATRLRKGADRASGIGRVIGLDQIDSTTGVIAATGNPNAEHDGPQAVFEPQTILFSRLRPNLNKVTIWPESWATGSGSGELLAYRTNEDVNPYYLFFVLKSPLGLFQVLDVTAGSTLPRVESEVVDSILVPRLTGDAEMQIGALVQDAHAAWYASADLIPEAKAAVESLIDGMLDEERLLAESAGIEAWLKKNPSPHDASRPKLRPEDGDP